MIEILLRKLAEARPTCITFDGPGCDANRGAALQVFGGYGTVSDFPVARIVLDVRVCQI